MGPEERELLRQSILRVLEANKTPFGVSIEAMRLNIRRFGFESSREDVAAEIDYLVDKGLAATKDKLISPEVRAWRITAPGRDFIAQQ